jgi:hypothetical protein
MKRSFCLFVLFFLITSCSEEVSLNDINFSNADIEQYIAVEGFVSNEDEPCRIKLTKPVSVSQKIESIPIDDATIVLHHRARDYTFQHDTIGVYFSIDNIIGIAGEVYTLEINYNSKTYTAEEIMPDEPNDEFNIPFTLGISYDDNQKPRPYDETFVGLDIRFHNFGYERTNSWGFEEARYNNDTFPDNDLYRAMNYGIYTHQGSIPQGIFAPLTGATGASGAATDSLEIIKAELSDRYKLYLLDKFNETDWQGGMFSTIPGNVSSNLSEGATGYFYALNVKRKRFIIEDFVDIE